ncbi:MAG: TonB family protein [Candidatus Eisenbacteria bacterium]|nr:TonB family protein [Candidatus Eisenbacteria bacterium]
MFHTPSWMRSAHHHLVEHSKKYLAYTVVIAIVIHALAFKFSPPYTPHPYQLREKKLAAVDMPDEIVIPPPPKEIARPQLPQEAEISEEAGEEETIAPTEFNPFAPPMVPTAPEKQVKFVAYDEPPQVVHQEVPEYPDLARQAEAEGKVFVRVTIDENGRVTNAQIENSTAIEALEQAAIAAAYRWLFRPAKQRDIPVRCQIVIPFDFSLEGT